MKIAGHEIKAAIFDLDGTILDSGFIWKEIDRKFFHKRNCEVPAHYSEEIAHIGLQDAARLTKEKYFPFENVEDILKEWNETSEDFYQNKIVVKPYVKEFLQYLKEQNIRIGIATANSSSLYIPCLKRNGIFHYFDYIADVDHVKSSKKSSKLYDDVAYHLQTSKSSTAIFEDLSLALKTAKENGYVCIGVHDQYSIVEEEVKEKYCDRFIYSFLEMLESEHG